MSEGQASNETEYAAEGTAAHELASDCLMLDRDAVEFEGQVIKAGKYEFTVDEEMIEAVQMYVDHVRELIAAIPGEYEVSYEQQLNMRHIHPDVWGTGDTVLYDVDRQWLDVLDYKHGKGVVVEVRENSQLFTYAAGAGHRYSNRPVRGITLWVIQPRAPHPDGPIRSWDADLIELMEFESHLRERALATEADDAPLNPGEWCRFCPALPTCPAARERSAAAALLEFAEEGYSVDQMTPEQMAGVLHDADYILNWVKAVQQHAHDEAVAGRIVPGFKLVAKRASRKWKDEATVMIELETVLGNDIYTEPKLRSPAQIEKLVGKASFRGIEEAHVDKVSSGTNLVPFSDPRPAVKTEGLEDFA